MDFSNSFEKGIVTKGNQQPLKDVMLRGEKGEPLTIGFIGGSITAGAGSSSLENSYAQQVFKWWEHAFCQSQLTYVNAGIGGTNSEYGVARVERDLLCYEPDVVVVEFSVNDRNKELLLESYESLIRKLLQHNPAMAVIILCNARYHTGENAQLIHEKVGRYYQLPVISVKDSLYQEIKTGSVLPSMLSQDNLHPNNLGHRLVSQLVIYYLEEVKDLPSVKGKFNQIDELAPLTPIRFLKTSLVKNNKADIIDIQGFIKDDTLPENNTDKFRNGWFATEKGAKLTVELVGNVIGIQYKRLNTQQLPHVKITVDNQQVVMLDPNGSISRGPLLFIDTLITEKMPQKHQLTIEIVTQATSQTVPFYISAFIVGSHVQE